MPAAVTNGLEFLSGGGEAAALIAAFDWSATALGPVTDWPQSLKSPVSLILRSPVPMVMLWGAEGRMIYNDAYSVIAGARHPQALGKTVRDAWPEIAEFNANVMRVGLAGGTLAYRDQQLTLHRSGVPEQVWLNLDYSPVLDERGQPVGVIAVVVETTARVLADRRTVAERDRLAAMFDQAPSMLALLDGPEHRIELSNREHQRATGDRDLIGKPFAEAIPESVPQGFAALLDEVYRNNETFRGYGWRYVPPGDDPEKAIIVDFAYAPVVDAAGAVTGVCINGVDVTDRVRSEAALRASEAELRALNAGLAAEVAAQVAQRDRTWEITPDLLSVVDADGRFERINPAWQATLGWPLDRVVGAPFMDFVHPDDRDKTRDGWATLQRGEPVLRFENRYRTAGGDYRWLSWVAVPEGGKCYSSARDVTEEKHQAALLAERTAERDRVWNNSRDLLVVIGADGVFRAVNPAWQALLGHDPSEVIGRNFRDFVWPDDAPATGAALDTAASADNLTNFVNRYRHQDGSPRWLAWHTSLEGEMVYAYGRDVTAERQQSEALAERTAELAARRAQLQTMFQTANAYVGMLDPDGTVRHINAAALAAIDQPLETVAGRPFWDTPWFNRTPGMADAVQSAVARARAGETVTMSFDADLPTGWRSFDFAMRPARDEAGNVVALVPEAVDVTERNRAEEALRQSQKMEAMGKLTGGVAHDFNNLLTPIIGSLDMLQRRSVGTAREQALIEGALQAGERARLLVQRLLAFARRQPLQIMAVDIRRVAEGMAELIAATAGPQIAVAFDIAADLPPALADAHQLEMALLNLAVNARDAMADGGRLTLAAALEPLAPANAAGLAPGDYLRLSIADTGTGMTPEVLGRAFEPFFSTKGIGRGTGLGLSMVHGLASQLGGAVTIDSAPGAGTRVDLWLRPSAAAVTAATTANDNMAASTRAGTALLVDDEDLVRSSTAEMLEEMGYDVVEVGSADAALELLAGGRRFDLLVTDHLMPGMTGTDLALRVRAEHKLPVLVISGYADAAGIAPDIARLTKPFRRADLARSLAALG